MRISHCVATFILASKLLSVSLYGQTVSVRLDTPNYPVMKDEWSPVSVTVSNICDHSFPILRATGNAYLGNENLIQVVIFKNELEGIPFLFDNPTGQRICSIATNEVPSFAMNTNAAILTVTLPVSRKTVRYYPRTGRIEEESMP